MFAFALWDENRKTLFIARDRIGIKPLYYSTLADGRIMFGSELKSVLMHPDVPREIDIQATEEFFAYGYVPDPKTIYRHVAKLPPGHVMEIQRGKPISEPKKYWDVTFDESAPQSEEAICEELLARLREAVDIRLISEVPLGAFLSGGVDSSAVVALMAGLSEDPVNTCSISFDQAEYDESRFAQQVAEAYGTKHHVRQVDSGAFDLLDRLANMYDEPFADSSSMPTYRVCALARERVTVALSGDGGDELFAGYRRYRWHHYEEQVRSRIPDAVRQPLFGLLGAVYPKLDWAPKPLRAKATLQGIARNSVGGYFHSMSILVDGLREKLYSPMMRRELQGYHASDVLAHHMNNALTDHYLGKVQYADIKTYLPGDILTKVDRASMANSLEVRLPILDHHFVEWSCGLNANLKLRNREGKYIFKKALERHLSNDVLYRDKMGFAVPISKWFRGPLRERVKTALSSQTLADTGLFDMNFVGTLVDQHQSGARDHSAPLWALLMFESFVRDVHTGSPYSAGSSDSDTLARAG
jgi:asparagine synthase (glutamine-hydrolysing)